MLAPDVRFEGFTDEDWQRVLQLFEPLRPEGRPRDPDRAQGLVIALHGEGRLKKLLHSKVGRLRLDDVGPDWPVSARELARRHDASWAITLEEGALEAAMESLGRRLRRDDDHTTQWLMLVEGLRDQVLAGRIEIWPSRLDGVPMPTTAMVNATLDTVCPPGKTMLIGLFDRHELWTSVALRRSEEGIDLILGPDELRPHLGLLSGDFRRDHRHLARLVGEVAGPLSLGCFAEQETFRRLEVDPTAGAWAMAVAVRDVVLQPIPPAMAVPLGLDAGRAAWNALRMVTSHFDSGGVFGPTLDAIREVTIGDRPLEEVLGFSPLLLLRRLLSRDD
ncbi:MAG: hypothetical protein KC731_36380 [Myxococcales bacterium]|nr:hypothetical protein [Myxococcales bacterium]